MLAAAARDSGSSQLARSDDTEWNSGTGLAWGRWDSPPEGGVAGGLGSPATFALVSS